MRRIRGSIFVSLDGVMQAPGGPSEDPTGGFKHGGWLPQFFDEDVGQAIDAFFGKEYDLLLGRRTYDIFAAYWPYVGAPSDAENTTGIGEIFDRTGKDDGEAAAIDMGEAFTRANKYVLTRGNPELGWSNSHRVGSIEELRAIRDGNGPDLLIQGSSTIYPALIKAGLLDRLTLMTFPVVLGQGKRPFGEETPAEALRMVDHKVTSSGAIIATYEPAGEVEHGWAGPQSTSGRERARQEAMAEGRW
jgi:dihydrofolate reductase